MSGLRRVFGNAAALYLLQAANYLFPLIIIPFLLRTIGVGRFGAVTYAASIVQLCMIITDFGFAYTATQRVSQVHTDPDAVAHLYVVVLRRKAHLMVAALAVLAVLTVLVPALRAEWRLILASVPMLVGDVLFPLWLFMGIQRMALITVINVVSRTVTLAVLVLLVREPADDVLAAVIQSMHFVIAGCLAQAVILGPLRIRPHAAPLTDEDRALFADSKRVFLASLAGQVYLRGTMFVLGLFVGEVELGRFAVAHRLAGLFTTVASPVIQSVYPHICALWDTARDSVRGWYVRLTGGALAGVLLAVLLLNVLAVWVTRLLAGENDPAVVEYLRWFSPIIVLATMNVVLNTFVMAGRDFDAVRRMSTHGALIFAMVAPLMTWGWGTRGMIFAVIVVETSILVRSLLLTLPLMRSAPRWPPAP